MRIISWNVRRGNIFISQLLKHAYSFAPDVLCLQEVPELQIPLLQSFPGYSLVKTHDFVIRNSRKSSYICILTKQKPLRSATISYAKHPRTSLLDRMIYRGIFKAEERHDAAATTISHAGKKLQIVNMRLSCAVPPKERIAFMTALLRQLSKNTAQIICGDFNIGDNRIFNTGIGWIRGYGKSDYRFDERNAMETLFARYNLHNIFRRQSTIFAGLPFMQLDHILIPETAQVSMSRIYSDTYGSDHRMLLADVSLS